MLIFSPPAEPEWSVVIVAYGGRSMLEQMLSSLHSASGSDVDVVVVDNDSPDDTRSWLGESTRGITVVDAGFNRGFGQGSNLGVRVARGRLVVLANTDLEFTSGWHGPLLAAAAEWGAAAPLLVDDHGCAAERGGVISSDGHVHLLDAETDPTWGAHRRFVDHVSAACLAIDRALMLDAGGFDPGFGLGYHEDVDLLAALAAQGVRPVWCPESVVAHRGGGSFGSERAAELAARNHPRNLRRWRSSRTPRRWPPEPKFGGAFEAPRHGSVVFRFSAPPPSPAGAHPLGKAVSWLWNHGVGVAFVGEGDAELRTAWAASGVEWLEPGSQLLDGAAATGSEDRAPAFEVRADLVVDMTEPGAADLSPEALEHRLVERGVAPRRGRARSPHPVLTSISAGRW